MGCSIWHEPRDTEEGQAVERGGTDKRCASFRCRRLGARRRQDLLSLLASLDRAHRATGPGSAGGRADEQGALLMTQPGVGPITSLAFVLTIGDVHSVPAGQAGGQLSGTDSARAQLGRTSSGWARSASKATASYACCWSKRCRMSTRWDESFRKTYQQRCHRMAKGVAKVAAARRLAVRLFWMLRTKTGYPEIVQHREQPAGAPGRRKLDR